MRRMRLLLCTHLLIVAASLAAAQEPNVPATDTPPQNSTIIIFNGGGGGGGKMNNNTGLADGWMAPGLGADINTTDSKHARPGSKICLSAIVEPFSSLVVATLTPFNISDTAVLDIWLRGSVLIRGALKIYNLNSGSESKPLILANLSNTATPPITNTTSRLLGPASDDWFRLQVNLPRLLENKDSSWDSIIFEDVSGQGLDIFIDQMLLSDGDNIVATGISVGDSNILTATSTNDSDLVPLYGGDITAQDANTPSPVIARLRPGVSTGQVLALCNELTGSGGRFDGSCTFQPTFNGNSSTEKEVEAQDFKDAPVEWPFLAITAKSESDLKAMRSALQETVEYFDRDKIANISIQSNRKLAGAFPSSPAVEQALLSMDDGLAAPAVEATNDVSIQSYCSSTPWNLDRIDQTSLPLDNKYTPNNNGAGVHVYMLDTGVRTNHEAFSGRVGGGADCTGGACRSGGNTADGNGHGTHTAGTAVGTCYGVAQKATLHVVKVLGDDGGGSFSGIIDGLRWVAQDVAANGGWPAVASLSLGGDRSKSLDDAVEAVVSAGIPVVVAAGNDYGADSCTKSPAGAPSAITVAATDINDKAAGFSNIGSCVDIWAPGTKITSASNSGDSDTRELSGTSMATPAVAGAIALLLQSNPNASPTQLTSSVSAAAVNENFAPGTTTRFLQVA